MIDNRSTGDYYRINRPTDVNRKTSWFPLTLSDGIHDIPEPSSYVLGALALVGLVLVRRKFGFRPAGR